MILKASHGPLPARKAQAKKLSGKGKAAMLKLKASLWSVGSPLRKSQSGRFAHVAYDFAAEADSNTLARRRIWKKQVTAARNRRAAEEATKIVRRVTPWAGSSDQASAWYRNQPIPAFGNRTAEALVRAGKAGLVHEYLDSIAVGGFA
jgi:hypothetical protein